MIHSSRRFAQAIVAFAAVAFTLLGLAFAPAAAVGQTATNFRSNGDLIAGWYWLRDTMRSHYAEYTFTDPPPTGDIRLEITALATDRVNGGPGVNAHFDLLVGFPGAGNMGGVFQSKGVTLQNIGGGAPGYTCHGYVTLPRAWLNKVTPPSGELFIRVVRGSAAGPHVAFRADSIEIVSDEGLREDLLDDILGDLSGGGTRPDGDALRDLLEDLLADGTTLDETTLRELLEQLLGGGGDIVVDQRGGTLDEQKLRELLEQLLGRGGGTIVTDERGGGIVVEGDDTLIRPELGDLGDGPHCLLDRPCMFMTADGFRSSGLPGAGGWFWMRSPTTGQTAEFLFERPPATGDLILDVAVKGQNRPGDRPRDTVHVNLVLGYPGSGSLGGQIGPIAVELPNLWTDPDDDTWHARALLRLSRKDAEAVIPRVGGLYLTFSRIDPFEPDVAFSEASVLLYRAQDLSR